MDNYIARFVGIINSLDVKFELMEKDALQPLDGT